MPYRTEYRTHSSLEIRTDTKIFSTVSYPGSTIGAILYNSLFRDYGVNAVFLPCSSKNCRHTLQGSRSMGFSGLTISMPFKQEIMQELDEVDETAKKIGAVNTVVFSKDIAKGYNTDWVGALKALEAQTPLSDKNVLLIGAGGAAKAVAFGLTQYNARISICNRTEQKAAEIAETVQTEVVPFSKLKNIIKDFDIVINTTSVGFNGANESKKLQQLRFKSEQIVMDIVFCPAETNLLHCARKDGARVIPGYKMLLYQALTQCRLWFDSEISDYYFTEKTLQTALSETSPLQKN